MAAEVIAVSRIVHGDGSKQKVFEVGKPITGLSKDEVRPLISAGSAIVVENPVNVEDAENDTIVRDTVMVMAGKYPSTIDRPAAVGQVPVRVVDPSAQERIQALEKENEQLQASLKSVVGDDADTNRAQEAARIAQLEQENAALRTQLAQGQGPAANAKATDGPKVTDSDSNKS